MRLRFFLLGLAALFAASAPGAAIAAERITSFESRIEVGADGVLTVTEDIAVIAEGRDIRRGIFRDFPVRYETPAGHEMTATFDVVDIRRDGQAEPYFVEKLGAYRRLYIGDADVFLSPGVYRYQIVYRTDRQLLHHEETDELYWNVTGDRWAFQIDRARAVVTLPRGAAARETAVFTGAYGARGGAATIRAEGDGTVVAETTAPLGRGQGLTIAVSWPAGFVARPTALEKGARFLSDNSGALVGIAGTLLVFLYFYFHWRRVGRDPEAGPLVPRYEPPSDMSPAVTRFVSRMGFDRTAFTAAIVNMAVKGYIKIEEEAGGKYRLVRTGTDMKRLSPGERAVARALFAGSAGEIKLEKENHKPIGAAKDDLKSALKGEYEAQYFKLNRGLVVGGVVLAVLVIAAMIYLDRNAEILAPLAVWIGLGGFFVYRLVVRAKTSWLMAARKLQVGQIVKALFASLFLLPFLGAFVVIAGGLTGQSTALNVVVLLLLTAISIAFYHLMKAPTRLGRGIMDRIAGFREFLRTAEKDRLNWATPPEVTPQLFEKYLPYAIALGVENEWAAQFHAALEKAGEVAESGYHPAWYSGRRGRGFSPADFSRNVASGVGGALATASTPPPSRGGSGVGGGGFSGGGGGGGGGGGW